MSCLRRVTHFANESDIKLAETVDNPETELLEDPLRLAMKNRFNPTQCLARTEAVKEPAAVMNGSCIRKNIR